MSLDCFFPLCIRPNVSERLSQYPVANRIGILAHNVPAGDVCVCVCARARACLDEKVNAA